MNLTDFHFIRPFWLLALFALLGWLIWMRRQQAHTRFWEQHCDAQLLPFILEPRPTSHQQRLWPLIAAASALAIIALAGPSWERLPVPAFRNEAALVIALDLSASMNATDIKPNRLSRARYKLADLLKTRKDGQTALLVYAGDAFVVTPLTSDTATIASQLNALTPDIMPARGSNTAVALQQAENLLKQAGLQRGQILLITDGADAEGIDAAQALAARYPVSVLGIGSAKGAPIAQTGGFLKDAQGNIVIPKLDSAQLSALANAGGGIYLTSSADDSDIQALASRFERDTQTASEQAQTQAELEQWDEKGVWLLLLALPLAALSFRKGVFALLPLVLLITPQDSHALDWQSLWRNADQRGATAFAQKQYEQAAADFTAPEWKAAAQYNAGHYAEAAQTLQGLDSARAHYNRGNALAKAGQLPQALEAYNQALKRAPDDKDAQHNKAEVEKQLQQQQQQQNQSPQDNSQNSDSKSDSQQNSQAQQQNPQQQPSQANQQQSASNTQQQQQQAESSPSEASKEQSSAEQTKQEQANKQNAQPQQADSAKDSTEEQSAQSAQALRQAEEGKQADAQWLKRIPDEPSGLLKRKFKYQYSSREQRAAGDEHGW